MLCLPYLKSLKPIRWGTAVALQVARFPQQPFPVVVSTSYASKMMFQKIAQVRETFVIHLLPQQYLYDRLLSTSSDK